MNKTFKGWKQQQHDKKNQIYASSNNTSLSAKKRENKKFKPLHEICMWHPILNFTKWTYVHMNGSVSVSNF